MKEKRSIRSTVMLSISVCFMFFIYAPLELYLTNKDEFWYDIYVLAPIMGCVFIILATLCILAFLLINKCGTRLYDVSVTALFIVFICSYIQGNYLIKYLPAIDGRQIDWSLYSKGRIESVVLWIAVIAIIGAIVKRFSMQRFHKVIEVVSICMMFMFIITLITLTMTNDGLESKTNICVTTDRELEMSTDCNFIILLLDNTDGGAFSNLVVGNEEYEKVFEDFTYYDNTVSAYPHTEYNVPFLLSGQWFENKTASKDYFEHVLTSSPFFDELEQRGFSIGMYETDIRIDTDTKDRFENVGLYTKKVSSYTDFARWQIMLVGMKYAPFDLKRFSVVDPTAFEKLRVVEGESEAFHDGNMQFYEMITEQDVTYRQDKNFKFIHLWGAHPPYEYDKELNYLPEGGTLEQSIEACITMTDIYLDMLKDNQVYDNSVIIILADHGEGTYYAENNFNQHPILLIKGINERHEFRIDDRPISFEDMQDAYVKLLDGSDGQSVFDGLPQERNRRFLYYDIKNDKYMIEYEQSGKAGDMNTMIPTGREYIAN